MSARSLVGLGAEPVEAMRSLLQRAHALRSEQEPMDVLRGQTVANLFFEDSTRTRTSFSIAARRLGADVVDLFGQGSSVSKGETLIDTALTVEAMGVSAVTVRTRQAGAAWSIAQAFESRGIGCGVVNAGDGRHEHPTQGLLDAYTIAEAFGRLDGFDLSGVHVAIVGDVASSRVAGSNVPCLTALGADVSLVGWPWLAPTGLAGNGRGPGRVRCVGDLDAVLAGGEGWETPGAVMLLRVQFERHGSGAAGSGIVSPRAYRERYALTRARADRLGPGSVVLHPGPMNRGLEIEGDVADGLDAGRPGRSVILDQVSHGVPIRMAVLERAAGG